MIVAVKKKVKGKLKVERGIINNVQNDWLGNESRKRECKTGKMV